MTNVLPSIHDAEAVERWRHRLRIDPIHIRRWRHAIYQQQRDVSSCHQLLPSAVREQFVQAFQQLCLKVTSRQDSDLDGATKLVLRPTAAEFSLESVLLRADSGRSSICVSSQIGCAAKCAFCATGRMKVIQQLSASEMLEQVVLGNRLLRSEGRRIRNVVFMGMGEPLHNAEQVGEAVGRLYDPAWFNLSPRRIIVSTVGIPEAMVRWVERFPTVTLAVSLHSADQAVRESLIPLAKKHSLSQLAAALRRCRAMADQPLMIEYLMLDGLTDRDADVAKLLEFLGEERCEHVNLIPYNPISGADHLRPTPRSRRDEFAGQLRQAGLRVTIRRSLGADIDAACGQLATADSC